MSQDSEHPSQACLNCGTRLSGPYCSLCGQKDQERILPLGHLLHDVFHEIWHLDARFLHTLKALLRPGLLTLDYVAGRRMRWFPPFRLYLIASLLLFLTFSVHRPGAGEFQVVVNSKPGQVQTLPGPGESVPHGSSPRTSALVAKAEAINRNPAAFLEKLLAWLPRVLFVLLPLFALLLKLAYLRTGTLYAVHVIFSLHEHAFAFLLIALVRLLDLVPHAGCLPGLLLLGLPIHLFLAMKKVYGQSPLATLLKAASVFLLHSAAALALLVGTVLLLLVLHSPASPK